MKICLIAEGCYPYVAGGVSSWVQMLIEGMPEHRFVIYTIGANEEQRGKFKYQLPANVESVEENFLDQFMDAKVRRQARFQLTAAEKQAVLDLITSDRTDWPLLFDMFAAGGRYNANEFLTSEAFLDIVMEACRGAYSQTPFNQTFWTMRSMLLPVLNILRCPVPEVDVFHTVSTGYAGLLGAMFSHKTGRPLLVTEHGIYSREREEEILKAGWVDVYFKQTWINFFLGMSVAAYHQADRIVSLFYHARDLQIGYGADPARCIVIPNGIKLSRFAGIEPIEADGHSLALGAVDTGGAHQGPENHDLQFCPGAPEAARCKALYDRPHRRKPGLLPGMPGSHRQPHIQGVEFVGRVDVAQWYGKVDIVLLSSISEGQPFVVLEAMASRRPVVATDVGSCRELLEGNGDGLGPAGEIVPVMNPGLMARSILQLAADPDRMRRMGENGCRRAQRYYREETFLQAYRDLYEKVKQHGGRRV